MKLWPSVTFPDVYCYLIETPEDFTGEKLKACILLCDFRVGQATIQVVKRNSGDDSHDATSPSSSFPHPPSDFFPPPF